MKMQKDSYRHEYKYPISMTQQIMEEQNLVGIVSKDSHIGESGYYNIRSIYFDDYYNRCFMENENGIDEREKYRIRIYNHRADVIKLECKAKRHGKTHKTSCAITKEQCELLMKGEIPSDIASNQTVLQRLAIEMAIHLMEPKIIVDYDRIPYVYRLDDANVRITFDYNISTSSDIDGFFHKELPGRCILPINTRLMEVKFDPFLPMEIQSILQLDSLTASTFSKYYLCRKYQI